MDQARARLEAELFGDSSRPARLGRFVLLERLGRGGMGSVYGAYDPELDRRVALKVLFHDVNIRARAQLRKEARSLAKLSHPNVVPVHDVVDVDGRVVLVMEYVAGVTVYDWQRGARRSWPEVLEVYVQIADGVAAAHALGIVHRDVKPQNAIVGDDGRVRVVDFGLARFGAESEPRAVSPSPALEALTKSGAVAGTPAYMSPEQFAGGDVGPASDQFSLCVALYRALYAQHPFDGATVDELGASVAAGAIRPPPRDRAVPHWLHAAVVRGLATDPAQRHDSVAALAALLGRDPSRRRRWSAALGVILALAGLSTWSLSRPGGEGADGVKVCEAGPERLATVWNVARRTALSDALVAAGRYGAAIRDPLFAEVDAYGEAFVTGYRDACLRHQRGEQSAALLDKRMACVGRRLDALDQAIATLLEVDSTSVEHAREVVVDLPPMSFCSDAAAMSAALPPPEKPRLRARVAELRKQLEQVGSLERLRKLTDARSRARAIVEDAADLGYAPVEAEAQLAVGRISLFERKYEQAVTELRNAERIALAHGLYAVAVEAVARRLYSQAVRGVALDVIKPQFELVEPLSRHLRDQGFARALLFNNFGVAYMAHEDPHTARELFERALAQLESPDDAPSELQSIVKNLAMVTNDPKTRRALAKRALEQAAARLGKNHTLTLELALSYTHHVENPTISYPVLKATCDSYAEYHPDLQLDRLRCLYYQGFLESELGQSKTAAETFASAGTLAKEPANSDRARRRDLASGFALLLSGRPVRAIERFDRVIKNLPDAPRPWWDNIPEAHARLGLGMAHLAAGRARAAIVELRIARAFFNELLAATQNVENRQRLALANSQLARALWLRGDRGAAAALFDQARAWYRGVDERAYEHRIEAINRWRR